MNVLESVIALAPSGKDEEYAMFTIDDVSKPFTLKGIADVGQRYTLSFWAMSEVSGTAAYTITVNGDTISATSKWEKHVFNFEASQSGLELYFDAAGIYYIYHPKLEIGDKATDWTAAPEDTASDIENAQSSADEAQSSAADAGSRVEVAESMIQQLADMISTLVTDGNGVSLMTQTEDGWVFSTAAIQESVESTAEGLGELSDSLDDVGAAVDALESAVEDLGIVAEYIKIGTYTYIDSDGTEQTVPSIDLGETDSEFVLKITNRRILFTNGAEVIVRIDSETNSLHIGKAEIEDELQIGGFVLTKRANGNAGLIWKGATE